MFGFGKKKEVPLKEQPGYGTAKHYHAYAVAEAEKNIKKYGINKKKYMSITFTPLDNGCLLQYSPNKNGILLAGVEENGRMGNMLLWLKYKSDNIDSESWFGDTKGKEIERCTFEDGMYDLASSDLLVPAFVQKAINPGAEREVGFFYSFKATYQEIQWRGVGYDSGYIGGMMGDPTNPKQAI